MKFHLLKAWATVCPALGYDTLQVLKGRGQVYQVANSGVQERRQKGQRTGRSKERRCGARALGPKDQAARVHPAR